MPFEKFDLENLDKERRKSLAKSIRSISVEELKAHIDNFIAGYNEDARPFAWTKSKVHQKRLKPCFAI